MDNNLTFCKLKLDNNTEFSIPFREDGYINATELCKAAGKRPADWLRLNQTKELIKEIGLKTNLFKEQLIQIQQAGNKYNQGTWIHRKLATHIAQWCSVKFAVQISDWIEEWISYKQENEIKYLYEIYNLKIDDDKNLLKEKEIQKQLHLELGGKIEVEVDVGFIDLLTDNEIIEIKEYSNWKHAVGQILMYSLDFPKHKKRIHLFNVKDDDKQKLLLERKCKKYDIIITYETNGLNANCKHCKKEQKQNEKINEAIKQFNKENEEIKIGYNKETHKKCSQCKDVKELKNFTKRKRSADGLSYECKDCKKKYKENKEENKVENIDNTQKKCKDCNIVKNITEYYKDGKSFRNNCKECFKKKQTENVRKRKEILSKVSI